MNNISEDLKNSEAFCVMPWIHLHISTNGDVNACCLVEKPFGNINLNSIKNIWNGNEIKKFRSNLLNNIKDERCESCYSRESSGGKSLRQYNNYAYLDRFLSMLPLNESIANLPIYWDIRFSNVCNFKCRTCFHGLSSSWFNEAVQLGETLSPKPIIRAINDLDKFYSELEELIDYVEQIYFAGGEPLVMDDHYRILNILDEKRCYGRYLRYNTNFSKITYKENCVFNIWKKFDNVSVYASLDGWGRRGEYLRKGQHWDDVLGNRELMKKICPNVNFAVSATISALNIFHIPDFHKELVSSHFIDVEDFRIDNLLQTPAYYKVQILPIEFKLKIKEKFERHIEWVGSCLIKKTGTNKDSIIIEQFHNCINYLFADDLSELIPLFVSRCNKLDELRRESTIEVFPELAFLF